jgi:hypothetical protein
VIDSRSRGSFRKANNFVIHLFLDARRRVGSGVEEAVPVSLLSARH